MRNFIDYSKDQLFILPPSLNGWVSDDDPAYFIFEAKVKAEWQLITLAYNCKRMLAIAE